MEIFQKIKNIFTSVKQSLERQFTKTNERLKKFPANEFSRKKIPHQAVNNTDLDYMSDAKAVLYSEHSPYINSLLYILVAFFAITILWAYFAVVEEVTRGVGKVIPSTHIKSIQSLDGGILAKLYVREGQVVFPGQVLAQLSVSDAEADYLSSTNHYYALLAAQARLQAEAAKQNTIHFPSVLADKKELINSEIQLFLSRKKELNERIKTFQHSYDIAKKQLEIITPLVKQGIISKIEFLQLQNVINEVQGRIENANDIFYKEVLTDLAKAQDEIKSLQERIVGLKERIARSTVRSPIHGIVKQIAVTTIGGVIKPGGDIMQIVPLEDTLLIETEISPKDIAFIHPGETATVRFTAYDYSIYGGLRGTVKYVSADTENNQKGETYYVVHILTDRNHLGTAQKPLPIIPGMTATVDIVTGQKSIADYLLKPIIKAKYEALRER